MRWIVRLDLVRAFAGFLQTRSAIDKGPLGTNLVHLIYQRVSILNGCAYCLAKHAQQLRDAGERPERVDALAGWRASVLYSARERAALAWTDALTISKRRPNRMPSSRL